MSCNRKYLNLQWTTINQIIKIIVWFIASKRFGCLKKKKCLQFYISFSYYLNPIMIPFISQDCSETFWQKRNFCSRIAISNCCSKSFSVKVKASFISNAKESFYHIQFLYTLLVSSWKQFYLSHKCLSNMEILRLLNFKVHGQILKFYKFTYSNLFLDFTFYLTHEKYN